MNADSLVYRVTMHVMKLCAHSPLLSISFKPFLCPCAFVPLFFVFTTLNMSHHTGTFHTELMWHWLRIWYIHGDLCNICHQGYSLLLKENYAASEIIPWSSTGVFKLWSAGELKGWGDRRQRYFVRWKAIKVLNPFAPDCRNLRQNSYYVSWVMNLNTQTWYTYF